ncbi:MAG: hypothetical protein ACRDZM_03840 [Acidimicrobiia bacterium]
MSETLSTLADLLTRSDFRAGVLAALVGLAVLFAASREETTTRWWGVVFTLAAVIVVNTVVGRSLGVSSGLFALGVGGWLLGPAGDRPTRWFGWLLVVAGALLVGWRGGLDDIDWLPLAGPVAILIGGSALMLWSMRLPHRLLGPMMAITAFGIWVTVPETEHARVLLGVALPLALATLAPMRSRLSTAGAFALAGLVVWVVGIGGDARPASIIGGWASLGALAILPVVRPNPTELMERRPLLIVGIHALFVLLASRVIGLWESAVIASVAVLVVSVVAFVVFGSLVREPVGGKLGHQGPE